MCIRDSTGGTCNLGTAERAELNGVDNRTSRDVAQRQVVARLDVGVGAGLDAVTLLDALRCDDVALLTVCVVQQGDACGAVRIVLDLSHGCRHAVLVPTTEVDEAVLALVTAATMAGGHAAVVVAAASFAVLANERLLWGRAREVGEVRNRRVTTARGRRLIYADSHNLVLSFNFSRLTFSYRRCRSTGPRPRSRLRASD